MKASPDIEDGCPPAPRRAAGIALGAGVAALVAAGVLLWAFEGSAVFVQNAFAALAACL